MHSHPSSPGSIRSFVIRKGRMGSGQQKALDTWSAKFVIPFQASPLSLEVVFGRKAPVIVEIGFGMGDCLAEMAAARQDINFLGIEVHPPGVGSLLKLLVERGIDNVRIAQHDAVEVFEHMVAPDSLSGIHIFFPDPWHKKRHHKRRLIQAPFVALLASRLVPGAHLHCATDWQPYAQQMLDVLRSEPALHNSCTDFAERPTDRPKTKFEKRGLGLGHHIWDVVFHR